MTTTSTELARSVTALIREFGNTFTLVHVTSKTYNSETGVVSKVETQVQITAVTVRYNVNEIDGASVLREDRKMYVTAGASLAPAVGDVITDGSSPVVIVSVHKIVGSSNTVIAYICQVRG